MHRLQDVLAPVVIDIWSSVLELEAVERPADPAHPATPLAIVGVVHLTGERHGAVVLRCADVLARSAAGVMFGQDVRDVAEADIRDAVGELTNVIAGNLKAALPDPYVLSLPVVVDNSDVVVSLPRGRLVAQTVFECRGGLFSVSVFVQDPAEMSKTQS